MPLREGPNRGHLISELQVYDREISSGQSRYPVEDWLPPDCGAMDIRIRADGVWLHEGYPIRRQPMVDLFSKLLRREGEDYYLVTPLEKLKIEVEDCPLQIIDVTCDDQALVAISAQGEPVTAGPDHPINLDGGLEVGLPRIMVRHGLWARFARPCYYRLMQWAEIETGPEGEIVRFGPYRCAPCRSDL